MLLSLLLACTGAKEDTGVVVDTGTSTDTDTTDPNLVGDCSTEPCGGDPVGVWTVASTCWDETPQPLDSSDCPSGTLTVTNLSITGTVTVEAEGAYETVFDSFQQDFTVHLPDECTSGLSCDDVQGFLEANIPGVVCADATPDGCDCAGSLSTNGDLDAGAWTVTDTSITFQSDDGSDPETNDFCADSDELWVHFYGTDGSEFRMLLTK